MKQPDRKLSPEFIERLTAESGGRTGWEGPDALMFALATVGCLLAAGLWVCLCWYYESLRLITLVVIFAVACIVAVRTLWAD